MEIARDGIRKEKFSAWDFFYALDMAIACLISYAVAVFILSPLIEPADALVGRMWTTVATVFVFRVTRVESFSAGISRLFATFVSFALCLVYLLIFPSNPGGTAVLIGLGTLIMMCLGRRADIVLTAMTTTVIMGVAAASPEHAWRQPLLRVADTVAGVAVGVTCKWIGSFLYYRLTGGEVR